MAALCNRSGSFRLGMLALAFGLILNGFVHVRSPLGHFVVGLCIGIALVMMLNDLWRRRRPQTS